MAVRTNDRRRALAREELRAVAVEARIVFGKIRYIGKCVIAFANFFPVLRGEFVARAAVEFLLLNVSAVREL